MDDASERIRPTPPEAFKYLTPETIEAGYRDSVERERARTSDEKLWEKLYAVYAREIELLSSMATYYKLAHNYDKPEQAYWQSAWLRLCSELKGKEEYIRCICWHLCRRGYTDVEKFLEDRKKYENDNKIKWVYAPNTFDTPTLHLG